MKNLLVLIVLTFTVLITVKAQSKVSSDTTGIVLKKDTVSQVIIAKPAPSVLVQMDDTLRSSGKIYVVITTIAIVFIGLAIYLFAMDRRLKKLEE
ncbi:CcmD family protein [Mucilaginibacter gracilis]|uniref:CcmD family protein n=1 Tax=Mucilaginibacter gracilis TaxID=423350 RepID=A0A495J157_9SPHI|nr:CcmD family protein [Mucilaginibacter gracilis]RKR82700.1 CcmD family protein [Mucilaginibacter gracilis]